MRATAEATTCAGRVLDGFQGPAQGQDRAVVLRIGVDVEHAGAARVTHCIDGATGPAPH